MSNDPTPKRANWTTLGNETKCNWCGYRHNLAFFRRGWWIEHERICPGPSLLKNDEPNRLSDSEATLQEITNALDVASKNEPKYIDDIDPRFHASDIEAMGKNIDELRAEAVVEFEVMK